MMERRSFLKAGVIFSVGASRLQAATLFADESPPRIIVLRDINSATNVADLNAVMTALASRQIPFVCAIDPTVTSKFALMPDHPVAQFLRSFYLEFPSLMELAPLIPDLELHRPYFQSRLASLAVAQLSETLGINAAGDTRQTISTVSCIATENPQLLTGLLGAGVRTVLSLPLVESQVIANRQSDNGILHLTGGRKLNFTSNNAAAFGKIVAKNSGLFTFSAQGFGGFNNPESAPYLYSKLDILRQLDLTGLGGPVLPRDAMIRDGNSFIRRIGLHILDAPSSAPGLQAAVGLMKQDLGKNQIGFSSSAAPSPRRVSLDGLAFWLPHALADKKARVDRFALREPVWASFSSARDTRFPPEWRRLPGQEVILRVGPSAWQGMDVKGRYHQRVAFEVVDAEAIAKLAGGLHPLSDCMILLDPLAMASAASRAAVLRALSALRDDAVTEIVDLQTLVELAIPPDPLLPIYRQIESQAPAFLRHTMAPIADSDALMQDARAAWAYFEKLTNRNTGLCTASNDFSAGTGSRYDRVTMWDIGSHINALIAANDLGLLPKKDFQKQTTRILNRIVGRNIAGLNLPPEEINVTTGRSTRNFNASDTCRLLASLANLADHPMADAALVNKVVLGWDIKDVIRDGRLHAIFGKKFVPADRSQYAHYSVVGLRRWGLTAASPYDDFKDTNSTDDKLQFLENLQLLGPFGTEPLLLDALDNGHSPSVDYLTDVLFTALLTEYSKSGRILCPSETPLPRPPWFIYQGYQIGDDAQPWKIGAVENVNAEATVVADKHLAISCKSAYLWAAVLDHPFAERLLHTVREKARDKVGFASCIFVDTGKASTDYSDINTNGIILQSIAYRLKGRA